MRTKSILFLMTLTCLLATTAHRALAIATPQQSCEAAVEKASGQYGACRLKAESVFAKTGDATKRGDALAKCSSKLSSGFFKALARYGTSACTTNSVTAFENHLTECADATVAAVNGTGSFASCGDGSVDLPGELCDGADLDGNSCTTLGFLGGTLRCTAGCTLDTTACVSPGALATGQSTCSDASGATIACAGTGQDGDLQRGAPRAYVDNGDGTVTDLGTGLQWEKLDDAGGPHDQDTQYGSAAALAHVAAVNAAAFAGHTDWRIPNARELRTLVDFSKSQPATPSAFSYDCSPGCSNVSCSCTPSFDFFRTSTAWAPVPDNVYVVRFRDGELYHQDVNSSMYLRLVRGGNA
ncbi:DUF1566 domain-containing protein [Candidatus Binatia bacterium]|nr:DUF1566 domain-containing protein [Candidatus Binatia bacterium]